MKGKAMAIPKRIKRMSKKLTWRKLQNYIKKMDKEHLDDTVAIFNENETTFHIGRFVGPVPDYIDALTEGRSFISIK